MVVHGYLSTTGCLQIYFNVGEVSRSFEGISRNESVYFISAWNTLFIHHQCYFYPYGLVVGQSFDRKYGSNMLKAHSLVHLQFLVDACSSQL